MGWLNQLKSLKKQDQVFLEEEEIPPVECSFRSCLSLLVAFPESLPCGFQACLTRLHNHISQVLEINLYIDFYIHKS